MIFDYFEALLSLLLGLINVYINIYIIYLDSGIEMCNVWSQNPLFWQSQCEVRALVIYWKIENTQFFGML